MTGSTTKTKNIDAAVSVEQRFCEGDNAVFDEVIEYYSSAIQRLAYRLLAWNQDADDVVQDVFVKALANRRKFRSRSSLKTWLFSITINTCRTRNRRRLLWNKFVNKQNHPIEVSSGDPVVSTSSREQAGRIQQAVQQLPGKYRDVIVLKYLEELPTTEILNILKINKQAFYTRLNRARNYLQHELSEYLENENE